MEGLLTTLEGNFTAIISFFTVLCLLSIIAQAILEFLSEFCPFSSFFGIHYKLNVMKNNFPLLISDKAKKFIEEGKYLHAAKHIKSNMNSEQLQIYKLVVAKRCRTWATLIISVVLFAALHFGDFANLYMYKINEYWVSSNKTEQWVANKIEKSIATEKTEQIPAKKTVVVSYIKKITKERDYHDKTKLFIVVILYLIIALFIGAISSLGSNHWHSIMKKVINEKAKIPKNEQG